MSLHSGGHDVSNSYTLYACNMYSQEPLWDTTMILLKKLLYCPKKNIVHFHMPDVGGDRS